MEVHHSTLQSLADVPVLEPHQSTDELDFQEERSFRLLRVLG